MIFWKYEEYMLEIIIVLALLTFLLWLRFHILNPASRKNSQSCLIQLSRKGKGETSRIHNNINTPPSTGRAIQLCLFYYRF